jgi:hypothetical protein
MSARFETVLKICSTDLELRLPSSYLQYELHGNKVYTLLLFNMTKSLLISTNQLARTIS